MDEKEVEGGERGFGILWVFPVQMGCFGVKGIFGGCFRVKVVFGG